MGYLEKGLVHIFADILSSLTILTCFVTKIPQIRTIVAHKSSRGISLLSICLEVFRYTVMWCYNYQFGYSLITYFEYPVLLVQQCILVFLVLKYNNLLGKMSLICAACLFTSIALFLTGGLPRSLLAALIPLCTPIGGFSKIMQFVKIVQTKDSATVSLMTWFLTSFTSFSRIYTVSVDSGDKMLLANSITSFVTSLSVFVAAFYYKGPAAKAKSRLQ